MLKNLQLTCLISLFFAGSLNVPLHAQTVQDSTVTVIAMPTNTTPKKTEGILVKGVVKSAKTKGGLSGISVAVSGFSAAITNNDGSFEIRVPNLETILKISGENFQTKVYALKKQQSGIAIFLSESNYAPTYQIDNLQAGEIMQYNSTNAASVVDFPEPVGPVTSIRPLGLRASSLNNSGRASCSQVGICVVIVLAARE